MVAGFVALFFGAFRFGLFTTTFALLADFLIVSAAFLAPLGVLYPSPESAIVRPFADFRRQRCSPLRSL